MKKMIWIIAIVIWAVGVSWAQKPSPSPVKLPDVQVFVDTPSEEDFAVLSEFGKARNALFECYETLFRSQDAEKSQTARKCSDAQVIAVAEAYGRVARRPNALRVLAGRELNSNYLKLAGQYSYGKTSTMELNSDASLELQRLTVLQNQRIIELLEQLVRKKP